MALHDIPATIRCVICIQHPDSAKSKVIHAAESHGVALLALKKVRFVVHLQDDMPCIVNVGEVGGNSGVAIDIIDVTYRG